MGWRSSMNRTLRILGALAVAAAAFSVLGTSGEPTWESEPAHTVIAGEPTWESGPAGAVIAGADELTWETAPVDAGAGA
jgi:hypothetical protein